MNKYRLMLMGVLLLVVALGACSIDTSCSDPGRVTPGPDSIATAEAPVAWSPDGKTIAVSWSGIPKERKNGVYLIDTADWIIFPLFVVDSRFSPFGPPTWSATGEWLAFATNAQIYKIKANGDSLTQLTFTSRQWFCDWSDSDSLIAYNITIGDSAGIWLMHPDGSDKREIISHGFDPCFTLADSILFLANTPTAPQDSAHLSLFSLVDSTSRLVYTWEKGKPFHFYEVPKVSPDGKTITLTIEGNVWTMTMEGKKLRQLTSDGGGYPDWSPDGSKIIYCKPTFSGGTLWIMNADGTGKTQIEGW